MDPHPALEPISFLVGTWTGQGHGDYPTIDGFDYDEEITIAPLGAKPMLRYSQLTWRAGTREPLHSETGYFRPVGDDTAELVIAQPTGITEIHAGEVDGASIVFRSTSVERAPSAVEVTTVERRIEVNDGQLSYELLMGAVGQPHQLHLEGLLERSN
jgi:hypothetical protein